MDAIIFGSISDGILNSEVNEKRNRGKKKKRERERKNKGGKIKRSGKFFLIDNQKKKECGVPFFLELLGMPSSATTASLNTSQ